MKILKIFVSLLIITIVAAALNFCSGNEDKDENKNNNEAIELKELKNKKQHEADSLQKEIELLKAKRDSLDKRIKDEQN